MRVVFLIPLFFSIKVSAQLNSSARFTALADASTALEDVFNLGSNQAGISNIKTVMFALTVGEQFYPSSTQSLAAMTVIPTHFGKIGLYVNKNNLNEDFQKIKSGISYAFKVKSKIAMALTINYHHWSVPDYLTYEDLSVDVGFQYRFSEIFLLGGQIVNPITLFSKQKPFNTPSKIRVGASYAFSNQILLVVQSDYEQDKKYDFRLGIEYSILNWLDLRGGTSINPFTRYTGIGINILNFKIDVASIFHSYLGVSPQLSLSYVF